MVISKATLAKPAMARHVGLVNAVIHKFTNRFRGQLFRLLRGRSALACDLRKTSNRYHSFSAHWQPDAFEM
jgi:hypothetical protein